MAKIKVSKELYEALNSALIEFEKEDLLEYHSSNNKQYLNEERKPLNELSTYKLAEFLINGYEFEQTPEEKLENIFNNLSNNKDDMNFKAGIFHCLNTLKIKIKGINDEE